MAQVNMTDELDNVKMEDTLTLSKYDKNKDIKNAFLYIVVVLIVYSFGVTVAIISYLKREKSEAEEERLYTEYMKVRHKAEKIKRYYRVQRVISRLDKLEIVSDDSRRPTANVEHIAETSMAGERKIKQTAASKKTPRYINKDLDKSLMDIEENGYHKIPQRRKSVSCDRNNSMSRRSNGDLRAGIYSSMSQPVKLESYGQDTPFQCTQSGNENKSMLKGTMSGSDEQYFNDFIMMYIPDRHHSKPAQQKIDRLSRVALDMNSESDEGCPTENVLVADPDCNSSQESVYVLANSPSSTIDRK